MSAAVVPSTVKIPLIMRLKAWWYGYELQIKVKEEAAEEEERPAIPQIDQGEWSSARIALLQMVFGEGFSAPGDDEAIMKLVKPCGLNSAHSLLELGSGLGGSARSIATNFGVWVEGLERDQGFVEAATLLSAKAGLAKKATAETYDPEHLELPHKAYNCVFSRDEFFSIQEKDRLIQVIKDSLKDNGHLLFTDYVLSKPKQTSPGLEAWAAKELQGAQPYALEDYLGLLRDLKFDVRIAEDISAQTSKKIAQSWAGFLDQLNPASLDEAMRQALIQEVEIWTERAKLLDSGELQACRIHAVKKVRDDLLSDWSQTDS